MTEASRNLGVNKSVLGRWKRAAEKDEGSGCDFTRRKEGIQAELVRFKKENQRLRMEREILKK
ncbi:MAG: transposase, partial [Desulfuromonadales bacterium]|nr:transposase [Desulfuromonadales bacterium]